MVSSQWFLGKTDSWALAFGMAGAHYHRDEGDFRAQSPRLLTADEQAEQGSEIENLDIPYIDYTVATDPNGADIHVDGP